MENTSKQVQDDGVSLNNEPATEIVKMVEGEHIPAPAETPKVELPEGATISFQQLGEERARAVVKVGEQAQSLVAQVRADVVKVLTAAADFWPSYLSGFTMVQGKLEAEQKDTRHLRNIKSQVSRVLKAAKGNPVTIKALMESGKPWAEVIKSLPKQSNSGRPTRAGAQPAAGEGAQAAVDASIIQSDGTVKEVNINDLISGIRTVATQLVAVSKGKKSPYGEYIGQQVLDMLESALGTYQNEMRDFQHAGGNITTPEFLIQLGLRKAA